MRRDVMLWTRRFVHVRKSQATCQKVVLFSRSSRLGTIFFVKMSNDSEESITSEPSESSDQGDSMEEIEVIGYVAVPYKDEPLASDDGDSEEDEEEADADGLTPAVLESRFEGQITVREW